MVGVMSPHFGNGIIKGIEKGKVTTVDLALMSAWSKFGIGVFKFHSFSNMPNHIMLLFLGALYLTARLSNSCSTINTHGSEYLCNGMV